MTKMTKVRDTADRARPLMRLQKKLIIESVIHDPTRTRPGRLKFTTFDVAASIDAEPIIVFHDAGEVIDIWMGQRTDA